MATRSRQPDEIDTRVEAVFDQIMMVIFRRTDRMFAYLMVGQWLFGIFIAIVFSPYTWSGRAYATHIHVYSAVLLGAAISSLPIALTLLKPGSAITRHTIAVAQMLWSALLIHLTGGRIETHFHVFGSLAFLAFYRDPLVLLPATVVVAADHFARGILWPESVYGITNPEWWRFLEHAFWVIFENIFLILSIRDSRKESRAIARRQIELEIVNATVESQVEERTSELAASREQYRSLLETTLAIPLEMDVASLRFTYVGPQAETILGHPASLWLTEQFLTNHVYPDDQVSLHHLRSLARGGKAEVEFRLLAVDGRWVWMRSVMNLGENANLQPVLRGIMLDVTEHRKLQSELAQAQKLESVGRLAAGIAHEINTPVQFVSDSIHFVREGTEDLTKLILQYQALYEGDEPVILPEAIAGMRQAAEDVDLPYLLEKMPKALERALNGLDHVAVIVRSMKEFAHPDQKEKIGTDINQSIASTLLIAQNECKYVADVETDFGDLPAVTCHVGEINQAVLNIVINAAHAIADHVAGTEHRGCIRVRTCRDGQDALIAISDTGGGIPDAIRDKIFDPFFTTKDVGRGTGQGLAIARSIVVDKHGGTIDFETEVGEGTTFYIRLPINGTDSPVVSCETYSVR
jgi:PAS domain S-box-containing protein